MFLIFSDTRYYCPTDARGHPDTRWWQEVEATRWSSARGARCVPIGPSSCLSGGLAMHTPPAMVCGAPGEHSARATTSPRYQPGSAPFRLGPPVWLAHGHARPAEQGPAALGWGLMT